MYGFPVLRILTPRNTNSSLYPHVFPNPMEDPGHLTPRTAIAEYYRSVTPRSANQADGRRTQRSYSHEDLAQRPRSNPRTRTPLRNPSPLMVGTSVYTPTLVHEDHPSISTPNEDVSLNSDDALHVRHTPRSLGLITWGAAMPQGTSVYRRMDARRNANASVSTTTPNKTHPRSRKGEPSHRKMRRWNNDRLQLSDLPQDVNITLFHNPDTNKREYIIPNAPRSHRGVFASLEQVPTDIREKIVQGEGIPCRTLGTTTGCNQSTVPSVGIKQISPRLFSFITRACQSSHVQTVMRALEQTLLQHFSMDNSVSTQDMVQPVWKRLIRDQILYDMPHFTFKTPLGIKMVQFHFYDKCEEDDMLQPEAKRDKTKKNPAFYRLLLHTISQYHGWNVHTGTGGGKNNLKTMSIITQEDKTISSVSSILDDLVKI